MTETFQSFMPEVKGLPAPEATVFIYALNDPVTGKCRYVGKAANPQRRFTRHLFRADESSTHKNCWIRGLRTRGLTPVLEVLDEVPKSQWEEIEREYIRVFRMIGFDLTNQTEGGDCPVLDESARAKLRAARKLQVISEATREKMRNRVASEETRKKMSESAKRRPPITDATRAKLRAKVYTDDWRAKLSRAQRANPAFLGKKHSEDSRARMSASHIGKPMPSATRKNMCLAQRIRRADEARSRNK